MSHEARLTEPLRAALAGYFRAVDGAAPGLVAGLFATGSVALGDYQHGRSDFDFVAITSRTLRTTDIAALRRVHSALGTPHFDGVYLDRATFDAAPDDERIAVHSHEGMFHLDQPCFELNPVLWRTLERHPIILRTPTPAVRIRTVESARLRAWCGANLQSYWQPLATRVRSAVTHRNDDAPVQASVIVWATLGPGRLHCTITTGDVISKTAASEYTARRFPRFASLLQRAVAARRGDDVRFNAQDARLAAELIGGRCE